MPIKFVYANGDSYVHGQGLDDAVELYNFSEIKKHQCWTGIIAKRLGLNVDSQYYNASLPGASNDRIFRTTVRDVSSLIKQYPANEIFVIIGLTDSARTEFLPNDHEDYQMFLTNFEPGSTVPHVKRMFELRNAFFVTNKDNEDRFFSKLIALQFFLKSVGVNYIFTKSIGVFPDTHVREEFNFKHQDAWLDAVSLIDFDRFYNELHFAHFVNIKNLSVTKCKHTGPDGHLAWAEHILDFVRGKYDGISKQFVA